MPQTTPDPVTVIAPTAPDRILSRLETAKLVGLSAATVWRGRLDGWFPEPEYLSPNRIGWRLSVVEQWMREPKHRTKMHKEKMDRNRAEGRRKGRTRARR